MTTTRIRALLRSFRLPTSQLAERLTKRNLFFVAALTLVVLIALGVVAYQILTREEPLDARFNGAYRLDDGRLVFITAREGDTLRYRMMSGESRALWPRGDGTFTAGPGWS